MASSEEVSTGLRDKSPGQFKMLAVSTHKAFDIIALDTEALEDKQTYADTVWGSVEQLCFLSRYLSD